jgi:hypothetical protein
MRVASSLCHTHMQAEVAVLEAMMVMQKIGDQGCDDSGNRGRRKR